MHLNIRNIGLNFDKDGVALLKVWAPNATSLSILLEETSVILKLQKRATWLLDTSN